MSTTSKSYRRHASDLRDRAARLGPSNPYLPVIIAEIDRLVTLADQIDNAEAEAEHYGAAERQGHRI